MHRFYAERLIRTLSFIEQCETVVATHRDEPQLDDKGLKVLVDLLNSAITNFEAIELEITAKPARRAKQYLLEHKETDALFEAQLADIRSRCTDELEGKLIFCVTSDNARYFPRDDAPLFGKEVDEKFKKKARYEISEAGKCLALDRPTACVFHLMRAVEVAIEAIRTCLQMPSPSRDQHKAWGAVLGAVREELDRRERLDYKHQWNSMADRKLFERMHMSLVAIKDGCRDDTMHVESVYPPSEAEHLFALTKGFIQTVTSRLDEDGQPLA